MGPPIAKRGSSSRGARKGTANNMRACARDGRRVKPLECRTRVAKLEISSVQKKKTETTNSAGERPVGGRHPRGGSAGTSEMKIYAYRDRNKPEKKELLEERRSGAGNQKGKKK